MRDTIKTPLIRFKGFTDDWEQRKLGEISDVYDGTHQTPDYTDSGVMFLSVENIKTLQSEKYISEEAFAKDFKIFPEKGDVLMTRIGDIGTANVIDSNEPKAYYVSLALLKHKKLDPHFLKECISSETVKKELWHRTLHIAFPKKINKNEIANVSISYPKLEDEQTQIGTFFSNLDNLITLHQRKIDLLGQTKQTLLQKMFPKGEEDTPEIRFDGFTDAWEQRKLGECFIERKEKSASGELISVTINDGIKKFADLDRHDSSSEDKSNYKCVETGDIAYNSMRMWQGASGYSPYSGILSPAYTVLIPKTGMSSKFFSYLFKHSEMIYKFRVYSQGLTSDTWNLKFLQFSKINSAIPKLEEQKQISEFFSNLDNLTTLHQRKLDTLKSMKQTLLKQMFI